MLLTDKGKRVADTPSIPVSLQLHILTITILLCVIVFQGFQVIGVIKPLAGAGTGSLINLQSAPASVPATATASLKTSGFFAPPKTRQDLGALLEKLGLKTGVELGVQRAHFAAHTLNTWPSCTRYYLVDIWRQQPNYEDFANVADNEQERIFQEATNNARPFANKVVFVRNYTNEAAKIITETVDFVYVDARHDYCGTLEDIQLFWDKIRSGGIMAGHDYLDAPQVKALSGQNWAKCMDGSEHQGAVKGAVDEFFEKKGLAVHVTYQDSPWSSWIVRKP
ncbi:hypothetical protein CHLRE_11g467900v5 [Chlamydomonas reinhardtii]|uniref:O-methyltransferase n=1 Tax=Chlamydomonas reinhardtii TaxID=3055 RepID=A0A2K3D833_CHLRE|nr:uncharacterized protein CHLRE_11g467900v5 [Chlamydomonas reinhardtii]PNW76691.1 hypothetical protein CHLRE_11g467900v5 [Chlamydomonas reinhardtii]